jgi:hypothetical protein
MVYLILLAGLIITAYCVTVFLKEDIDDSDEGFCKLLSAEGGTSMYGSVLFDLKEKVETELAETRRQKELVIGLLLRMERQLENTGQPFSGNDESGEKATPEKEGADETLRVMERAHLFNSVYLMHDRGMALTEIAKQAGLGKGEIELILGMRK